MKDALLGLLVAGLTGLLLLGSCGMMGNDQEEKTKADSTYFRATLNDEESWSGHAGGSLTHFGQFNLLNIHSDTSWKKSLYNENLSISLLFSGEKMYYINSDTVGVDGISRILGASYYEKDGDVKISGYHSSEDTSANRLMITSYDSTAGVVKGTFRTTVVVDSAERVSEPGEPDRRRPDTLRFTDGEFRVKIEDRRDE